MKRESPSPNMKIAKSSLRKKAKFLGRCISGSGKQISQENSIYGSLDDQFEDYKKTVKFAELP